jgi:hypothetical protein
VILRIKTAGSEISFSHGKWVVEQTLNVKLVDLQALNYLIK